MAKRKSSGKKRTLSPEQLQKMKEGRERKKRHEERMKDVEKLENSVHEQSHDDGFPRSRMARRRSYYGL